MARRRRDVCRAFDDERSGDVLEAQRHADADVADRSALRAMLERLGQVVDLATTRAEATGRKVTPTLTDWREVARRLDEGPVLDLRQRLRTIERLYGDLDADELHVAVQVSCLRRCGWLPGDIARAVADWNGSDDDEDRKRTLHNARRRRRGDQRSGRARARDAWRACQRPANGGGRNEKGPTNRAS